jgi:hypothetical protein
LQYASLVKLSFFIYTDVIDVIAQHVIPNLYPIGIYHCKNWTSIQFTLVLVKSAKQKFEHITNQFLH